jgi:hypothetical protein
VMVSPEEAVVINLITQERPDTPRNASFTTSATASLLMPRFLQ